MLQTSISAWLNKPRAVAEPPPAPSIPLTSNSSSSKASNKVTPAPTLLPTPSPSPAPPQKPPIQATPPIAAPAARKFHPLPQNVTLEPVTASTLPSFRRLNSLLLPIPYPQKFYDEIVSDPVTASITLVALWQDPPCMLNSTTSTTRTSNAETPNPTPSKPRLIAGIRCRLLPGPPVPGSIPTLYVATLATLSPFRELGLASHLLHAVTSTANSLYGVVDVCAHVWEANTEALEWYLRRGFEVRGKEEGYYRRLSPRGAWCVGRRVGVGDLLVEGAFGGEEVGDDEQQEGG